MLLASKQDLLYLSKLIIRSVLINNEQLSISLHLKWLLHSLVNLSTFFKVLCNVFAAFFIKFAFYLEDTLAAGML